MRIQEQPSPNWNKRPDRIDTLVLHYTGMTSSEAALARLCDPNARVSAHYLVSETGVITRLVAEENRAWHAGVSAWRGRANLNDTSIGIEIANPGHEWGYRPFPAPQIERVIDLCHGIVARWDIQPENVVGHSDIAPTRKLDPGEFFPWPALASHGIGHWTQEGAPETIPAPQALDRIGYACGRYPLDSIVEAFQRRWMPATITGALDAATTARIVAVAALFAPWRQPPLDSSATIPSS